MYAIKNTLFNKIKFPFTIKNRPITNFQLTNELKLYW